MKIIFSILFLCAFNVFARPFTIYEFLPWGQHIENGHPTNSPALQVYLHSLGIQHAAVVYDFATNGKADTNKIYKTIERAAADTNSIVSFDTEFGKRFQPDTVIPEVLEILRAYRSFHPANKVGVYATAPQNTYGWSTNIQRYDSLNAKYQPVADAVDFLSPCLYVYRTDLESWKKAAAYNVDAANKYHTGKPVIPYIDAVVDIGTTNKMKNGVLTKITIARPMTEQEMAERLQTLYDLGASGCIIWGSSGKITPEGKQPVFDRNSGWGKAAADFAQRHEQ